MFRALTRLSRHTLVATAAVASAGVFVCRAEAPAQAAAPVVRSSEAESHDDFTDLDLSGLQLDHHLIHAGLSGEDKVHAYKLSISSDKNKLRATARLGSKVCGHPSLIHGGALAVLLDDSLGTLFLASGRNGFTANLNINYRRPVPSGTIVRIEAQVSGVEPSRSKPGTQKVSMAARIVDDRTGVVYTEATALFISKEVPSSGGKSNKYFPQA